MAQDHDKYELKIRRMFRMAAMYAAMSIFLVAIGLNIATIHAVRNSIPGTTSVPEILIDQAWFLLSAFWIGLAVLRFGEACMCLAKMKEPADRE